MSWTGREWHHLPGDALSLFCRKFQSDQRTIDLIGGICLREAGFGNESLCEERPLVLDEITHTAQHARHLDCRKPFCFEGRCGRRNCFRHLRRRSLRYLGDDVSRVLVSHGKRRLRLLPSTANQV